MIELDRMRLTQIRDIADKASDNPNLDKDTYNALIQIMEIAEEVL